MNNAQTESEKTAVRASENRGHQRTPVTPAMNHGQTHERALPQWLNLRSRVTITLTQLAVIVVVLVAWQYLPQIGGLSRWKLLDPYFISSPTRTFRELLDLMLGRNATPSVWPYALPTFLAAIAGTIAGLVLGGLAGLLLASSQFGSDVLRPFVVALNAIPRIALIPIVVVIFGATVTSSLIVATLVVFFVGTFNAYEGGRSVEAHVLQNARLLGASGLDVMLKIRFPYSLAWTLASLPVAVSFAIVAVVTGEILTGYQGMGLLINQAASTANSNLTFAVIIILAVLALIMLAIADAFKRRVLHWWIQSE